MKLVTATIRKNDRRISGLGTVETMLLTIIACVTIIWAYNSAYETFFGEPSESEGFSTAEQILSTTEAARFAGLDFIVPGNIGETIERVATGTKAQAGQFAGQFFGMPQLSADAKRAAANHLYFDRGQLTLNQTASRSPSIRLGDG